MTETRTLLIVGGHGVAGGGILRAAKADAGVRPVTVSRRSAPGESGGLDSGHIAADLLDGAAIREAVAQLDGPVDVAFAAYAEHADANEATRINLAMLRNLLDALDAAKTSIGSVVLVTGAKAYGPHLGPYKTPAKESDPRVIGPLFYYDQVDALREWADRHGVGWTELRPDGIIGHSVGSPMNLLHGMAAYGTISAELGLPLRFPGHPDTWSRVLHQLTDSDMLGRSVVWATRSDAAHNEAFNVTNGDYFRWAHLWPELAKFFDVEADVPKPIPLATQMAGYGKLWKDIGKRHKLRSTTWEAFVSWGFVEAVWNIDYDLVQSTVKIRQAGFQDSVDTHASIIGHLGRLREASFIP